MPPGARRQGGGTREASTGVKAPRCQGAMQYCSWPSSIGHLPDLAPVLGCERGRGLARSLERVGRRPKMALAAFQEAAPVLEVGQGGQDGQRIGDICDRVDVCDTYGLIRPRCWTVERG